MLCGICGIFSFDNSIPVEQNTLEKMCRALKHRGPDDQGTLIDGNVGIGNRRLDVIDLKLGHQPMTNEDSTIWIVYNGETYNFMELRESLIQKGHVFSSQSDTEVLIHLYEEKGENFIREINGMFAFAIWDKNKQCLFLARDRSGKKPLYYTFVKGQFVFASEIKGLLQHPEINRTVDRRSLREYLLYGYIPAPNTIFKNIKKLEAAHTLTVTSDKKLHKKRFWDLPKGTVRPNIDEIEPLIRDTLERSVKRRLKSDVPLGLFLSGGIDSSLIAFFMSKLLPAENVNAYCVGFVEQPYDESAYAEVVSKHLGITIKC